MSVSPVPNAMQSFEDENGKPYSGGQVMMCQPGTLTLKATYSDENGTIANLNPVLLDAAGRCVMWGSGNYRQILYDSLGNEIWDRVTACALPGDVISAVMLPVVGAQSLQQARDLMGVTAAIQAATAAMSLLSGPTGPQGPPGIQGTTGPTGPAGSAGTGATSASGANPGYWFDGNTSFLLSFGSAATNGSGVGTINFAKPYTGLISIVAVTQQNSINCVLRVVNQTNTAFNVIAETTDNRSGVATNFNWSAFGFST